MDARSCPYRSLTSLLIVFLVLVNVEKQNVLADSSSDDDALLCATDLSSFLPLPYSNLRNMVCKRLWNSFMLRVSSINYTHFCHSYQTPNRLMMSLFFFFFFSLRTAVFPCRRQSDNYRIINCLY